MKRVTLISYDYGNRVEASEEGPVWIESLGHLPLLIIYMVIVIEKSNIRLRRITEVC